MQYCRNCPVGIKSHRSNSDRFLKPLKWDMYPGSLMLTFNIPYPLHIVERKFSAARADLLQVCLLGV